MCMQVGEGEKLDAGQCMLQLFVALALMPIASSLADTIMQACHLPAPLLGAATLPRLTLTLTLALTLTLTPTLPQHLFSERRHYRDYKTEQSPDFSDVRAKVTACNLPPSPTISHHLPTFAPRWSTSRSNHRRA